MIEFQGIIAHMNNLDFRTSGNFIKLTCIHNKSDPGDDKNRRT